MRALMESLFDIIYLVFVISMGFYLIAKNNKNTNSRLFGIMAVILGFGDAFHLVPRILALNTANGFEVYRNSLGIGKAVTSVTMTIFYIILYYIFKNRYNIKSKTLDLCIWILGIIRVILTALPQNKWTSEIQPLSWGIYRNIPFVIMGIIMIALAYKYAKEHKDKSFKNMYLAIFLSFIFYIPVVLWGDVYPLIGMLMIPKTLMYVWIVTMGYKDYKGSK
ncbi:hypothetical protein E8P77_04510 [Soehngenia saccharolytica]|nr:hypothetical protein E8P77_04510 [Soehngenia saccharolytica]